MQEHVAETGASAAAKIAFPGGVTVLTFAGVPLEQWVFALTLLYLALMIAHHITVKWIIPLARWWSSRAR